MKTSINLFPFVLILFASPILSQNCQNSDFESSTATVVTTSTQVSGWTATNGNHAQSPGSNNCNLTACCPGNPMASAVIDASSGFVDPVLGAGYPIYSVFGAVAGHTNAAVMNPSIGVTMTGTNVFRLNSTTTGPPRIERLSKTLSVTPTNFMFDIAHMCVFSRGHDCCNAPQLLVTINNFTCPLIHIVGNVINPCPDSNIGFTFYTNGTPSTVATATTGGVYTKWDIKSLDLSAFMGQTVTVNFTASHCTASGHYIAAYLDTRCGPGILTVNGTTVNLGPVTTTACSSAATATITAPPFFNTYQWTGPSGFTASTAVINTTLSGTYTLSFGNVGSCSMSTKTINIVIGQPTVNVSTNYTLSCAKNPVVLTASALANYSWSTGSTSPSITVSPSVTTVYTLTGKNSSGCTASASFTQNVSPCAGLDNYAQNNTLKVFPNPNHGEFTVLVEQELKAEFVLENSLGQIVHSQHIQRGENKIKTTGLADGIYYYRVVNGEKNLASGKIQLRH